MPSGKWVNHRDTAAPHEDYRQGRPLAQPNRSRDPDPRSHKIPSASPTRDKRKGLVSHSNENVGRTGGNDASRNPKRGRDEGHDTYSKASGANNIFVEGVNQKDNAGSFWDSNDPNIGWKRGRELVGDYDMLHLLPKSTAALTHSFAWNACQVLSLASAFRVREER